ENLSELRAEERTTGGKVHLQSNDALFTLDTKGDGKVHKEVRQNKPLKMDEILQERSKVPAVAGQKKTLSTSASIASTKPNAKISKAEKAKLLDMIRRKTSNSLFAPVTKSHGRRGMTDAVKTSGSYDVWSVEPSAPVPTTRKGKGKGKGDFVSSIVTKVPVKAPKSFKHKLKGTIPAVKEAHPGASYNPTMQDHQELLKIVNKDEMRILDTKKKLEDQLAYPKELDEMLPYDDQTGEKAKEEAELKRQKDLLKQTTRVKEIMKSIEQEETELEQRIAESEQKREEKEKAGMKRVGRFNVPRERINFQLSDELSESLRQLKPEGSLMKDRFQSFVERNLVEPRVPVGKRRRYRLKTYEKHSYKRFDNPMHG
ncbi:hypothetical protein BGW38_008537, partial [Lunasporangiospora selenospora]